MTLKRLPRGKDNQILYGEFQGKTKRWIIQNPMDGIGINRFIELDRFKVALGYASTFKELYQLQEDKLNIYHKEVKNDVKLRMLHTADLAVMDKITDLVKKDPNLMMVVCSLFIVGENEDLSQWNIGQVETKTFDWDEYNEWDFFELALITLGVSMREYKSLNQSLAQILQKQSKTQSSDSETDSTTGESLPA